MEISAKWIVLEILIFQISTVSCFYPEFFVEDFCKSGNETIVYDASKSGEFGTLTATSHPPYSANKNCWIIIEPPLGKRVVLSVRKIDMRERLGSCFDYLEIVHGDVLTSPTQLCRFQHDLKEKTSFYSKGSMQILFYVDPSNTPKFSFEEGFTLTYTIVSEDIQDCIGDDSFMCGNGRCMTRSVLCDGRNNCGDRSDESSEICELGHSSFYYIKLNDVFYIVFCALILSVIISCGVFTFHRHRARFGTDTDSRSDLDEPTTRLAPYQAVHPSGFFICQNPAGPRSKVVNVDGGFSNPCFLDGVLPLPPPPYTQ